MNSSHRQRRFGEGMPTSPGAHSGGSELHVCVRRVEAKAFLWGRLLNARCYESSGIRCLSTSTSKHHDPFSHYKSYRASGRQTGSLPRLPLLLSLYWGFEVWGLRLANRGAAWRTFLTFWTATSIHIIRNQTHQASSLNVAFPFRNHHATTFPRDDHCLFCLSWQFWGPWATKLSGHTHQTIPSGQI